MILVKLCSTENYTTAIQQGNNRLRRYITNFQSPAALLLLLLLLLLQNGYL